MANKQVFSYDDTTTCMSVKFEVSCNNIKLLMKVQMPEQDFKRVV